MALDEEYEAALYKALADVINMPRPKQKERILRNVTKSIFKSMGWNLEQE